MDGQADKPPRRVRVGTVAVVALIHVATGIALVRSFAFPLDLPHVFKEPPYFWPEPITFTPEVRDKPKPAAPQGRKANPREVSAPEPVLPWDPAPAPPVSGSGQDNAAGAAAQGAGTGAGGDGSGTGGGGGQRLEKIAGDINSARDYARKTRDLRIGQSVTILLEVGSDGRVSHCKVTVPSPDPEADATTCRLATARFRFRPATDRSGNPVPGQYAWRQRWYYEPASR